LDIALAFLGGLGLFLTGLRMLSTSTKALGGPWLRRAVAAGTRGPLTSAFTGLAAGTLTQSTSAVTVVGAGLVQAGLLEVRRALPLLSWTNVGTCGVVLMASFKPQTLALALIGVAGIAAYFGLDWRGRLKPILGALIGLGVVFLGLGVIKAGIAPLRDASWMQAAMAGGGAWLLPPFLIGGLIAFVSNTSSTATLIALALTATGLMGFDGTVMAVYGASIGSGLSMLVAVSDARGAARRLGIYQVLWKSFGTVVFLLLFFLERAGVPLVLAASGALAGGDLALRVGVLVLLFQAGTALLIWPLDRPMLRLLARLSPETAAEALSRPRYIYPAAVDDPATAVALARAEMTRLAERLPLLLDAVREDGARDGPGWSALDGGSATLEGVVDGFLAELVRRGGDAASIEEAVAARARLADLVALREAVAGFAQTVEAMPPSSPPGAALRRMAEALHLLLEEFAGLHSGGDAAVLRALTVDRSEMLEALRRGLLRAEGGLAVAAQEGLFRAFALFERAVWLMRRGTVSAGGGRPPVESGAAAALA
jgi:phosphate:Na+ symporter